MPADRPAPVRLDDLAAPRFTPDIAALRESIAPMADAIRLEPDPLIAEARDATGLEDLGDRGGGAAARLTLLLTALREEGGLTAFGVVNNHGLITQLLKNRLLLTDLLARHPEIHDVRIERPIVVAGLPRTGTTHLHNLLAADPALRSLPYWESLEPVLPEHDRPAPGMPDPRIERTAFALGIVNASMPYFVRMHEMTADHAHEEIQLLAMDFSSMLFETMTPMPRWRDDYLARDQTPHYEYLRQVLQALQWLRGGERWVLKSPQHLEQLGPLLRVFPDATVVLCHRDPVAVTGSVTTMLAYTARMASDHPDPVAIGRYWADRIETLLTACLRDRDTVAGERCVDVRFPELLAGEQRVVERIYAAADQPLTEGARAAMDEFLTTHPRGRHGTVVHDLAAVGVDPEERRGAMTAYTDRFDLPPE